MKHLGKLYTIALLLFISSVITYAQKPFLDSIHVRIDDKMECFIAMYDYKDLGKKAENDLRSFQSIIRDSNDITEFAFYSIFYIPNKSLSVKQTGPGEIIIWENGKQTRYQFNKQLNINSDSYKLQILFNDLNDVVSENLINKLKEVIDTTNTIQNRFSKTYNYSFKGENLVHNNQLDKVNGQLDLLSLKGGVGVSLIKNKPVADISAEIGLIFCKKGMLKNQYYVSYNGLSVFDDNQDIKLNGFANIGYRYNLSHKIGDPNWLGLELGYLVNRQGDFLEKNTMKFGMNWEISKYITVSPQIYISGDFSKIYPGVRIGFGL